MQENQFFVDSDKLSEKALEKKHRLETDPSVRTNHMEYMEGMEQISSDIMEKVLGQMEAYDYSQYTAADVQYALSKETCSVEDFKALLSPAAEPFLEQMAQRAKAETGRHFGNTVYIFTPLYIANYCENYCVYCGFNCYNDISRKKLNAEEIEKEMKVIADSGYRGNFDPDRGKPADEQCGVYRGSVQNGIPVFPECGTGNLSRECGRIPLSSRMRRGLHYRIPGNLQFR